MQPAPGLSIITGETGAGKSIMLGAVGLLLGKRADTKVLLDSTAKCIVEGLFDIAAYALEPFFEKHDLDYAQETTLRREITPAGKSRAFVNDTPVNLETLKALGDFLMDVHSQNETLQLGATSYQLNILDSFAGTNQLATQVNTLFNNYHTLQQRHTQLTLEAENLKKEVDYNHFLLEELTALNLQENEQEPLEEELKKLENAEDIKVKLNETLEVLNHSEVGTLEQLQNARTTLQQLTGFGSQYQTLFAQLEQAYIELKELTRDLEAEEEQVEVDFERTEQVQQRLSTIYQLQTKHKVGSVKELLVVQTDLEAKVFATRQVDDDIAKVKQEMDVAYKQALALAEKLSSQRNKAAIEFGKQIESLLAQVGIAEGQVTIELSPKTLASTGIDNVAILFSANKGLPLQPLKQVASGGEFSRLMFCIKYLLAGKTALPTVVFDEIDTGISGEIALKMGAMMQKMATNHQVIAISHLPQIAAKAHAHYFVYKNHTAKRSASSIKLLSPSESTEAIAQMIGGENPSESAYKSARELMELE